MLIGRVAAKGILLIEGSIRPGNTIPSDVTEVGENTAHGKWRNCEHAVQRRRVVFGFAV
jgi:hypothetical protein